MLDVEQAAGVAVAVGHFLPHGEDFSAQRVRIAPGGEHGGADGLEARADGQIARAAARPGERLMFPGPRGVAAAAALVAVEGLDAGDQQPGIAVGAQPGIDFEQTACGGVRGEPPHQLAGEGGVDFLRPVRAVVVEKDDVEIAAVAQFLAAEFAVGDHGEGGLFAVTLRQFLPAPFQRQLHGGIGQGGEFVGHLLDLDQPSQIAREGAEHFGVKALPQQVHALAGIPAPALRQLRVVSQQAEPIVRGVEALARWGDEFVHHGGVALDVIGCPGRGFEHIAQPRQRGGLLGEKRQIGFAPPDGFEQVDDAGQAHFGGGALGGHADHPVEHAQQPQPPGVAQSAVARRGFKRLEPRDDGVVRQASLGQPVPHRVHAFWRLAAAGALRTVMQQGVELAGDEFAHLVEFAQQLAALGAASALAGVVIDEAHRPGQCVQVGVFRRHAVGLRVVEVLNAMLQAAQKAVARRQPLGRFSLQQIVGNEQLQCGQGGAFANLRHAPTAHHLQQLHGEFDFANTAPAQLDIVGFVGPGGGAFGGLGANLPVQRAQGFEHAEVEIAPPDEGLDHRRQPLRGALCLRRVERRNHARLEPGKPLPLAPLHQKIFFEHAQADHWRAAIAVGPQPGIDAEDEAVARHVRQQRHEGAHHAAEVFAVAQRHGAIGLAVFVVHEHQIDVGRHIEFAPAQLAHADHEKLRHLAGLGARRAKTRLQLGMRRAQPGGHHAFRQIADADADGLQRRARQIGFDQSQHQRIAHPSQHRGQRRAGLVQGGDGGVDFAPRGNALRPAGQHLVEPTDMTTIKT